MNAELHYGGQIYKIVGGEERATQIVTEARKTIASGGGTISIEIGGGSINCAISAAIPFAVVLKEPATVWV